MQIVSNRMMTPRVKVLSGLRVVLVLGSLLVGFSLLVRHVVGPAVAQVATAAPASAAELLTAICAVAAAVTAGRLWVLVGLECVHLLRCGMVTPDPATQAMGRHRIARRLATLLVGASAFGLLGGPVAHAAPAPTSPAVSSAPASTEPRAASPDVPGSDTSGPEPGFRPTAPRVRPLPEPTFRPTDSLTPTPASTPSSTTASTPDLDPALTRFGGPSGRSTVVVLRGDTLWSLAAAHLGPGATDAEIARAWPRWFAANEAVIGPNPDLLLPGQILSVPVGP